MARIGTWELFARSPNDEKERWYAQIGGLDTQMPGHPEETESCYYPGGMLSYRWEFKGADLMKLFEAHRGCGGSHCGLTDIYDVNEQLLRLVLEHDIQQWDTGWYASKKEIASGRIRRDDQVVTVEASVSDDFDTEGGGTRSFLIGDCGTVDEAYDTIMDAIGDAWEGAEADQKENREYHGFSIHPTDKKGRAVSWCETLILPAGDNSFFDAENECPPGDNYHKWMWQDEACGKFAIPNDVKEQMEDWAWKRHYGQVEEDRAKVRSKHAGFYQKWGRGLRFNRRHRNTTKVWEIRDWDKNEKS